MIQSFKDKLAEKVWKQIISKGIPIEVQRIGLRKLIMLNSSIDVNDLRIPPSNHLEKLKADREGQYSIRINDQWRICFKWENGNAFEVEIVDYH
jgi:proteic killer suppression protein